METRLRATDPLYHLGGKKCDKRVWLRDQGEVEPKPASDFKQALAKLGDEHEQRHAATWPDLLDLGDIRDTNQHAKSTKLELEKHQQVICSGTSRIEQETAGVMAKVTGHQARLIPGLQ